MNPTVTPNTEMRAPMAAGADLERLSNECATDRATFAAPLVYVIIPNWNGFDKTVACLNSLRASGYPNFITIVVDNGSTDGCPERLKGWRSGEWKELGQETWRCAYRAAIDALESCRVDAFGSQLEMSARLWASGDGLMILSLSDNVGFARACNIGIRHALCEGASYVWLLNSDTVVPRAALGSLVGFLECESRYDGVTPRLLYLETPELTQNCGGRLTWYGSRRNYHAQQRIQDVPATGARQITYISGCAPLFRARLFWEVGLLTEQFFFGEEDLEFSWRNRRFKKTFACLYSSSIFHSYGASIQTVPSSTRTAHAFLHYLNRFIHMRRQWPRLIWELWRIGSIPKLTSHLTIHCGCTPRYVCYFLRRLFEASSTLPGVTRETFQKVLAGNY